MTAGDPEARGEGEASRGSWIPPEPPFPPVPETWAGLPLWVWGTVLVDGPLLGVIFVLWRRGKLFVHPFLPAMLAAGLVFNVVAVYAGLRLLREGLAPEDEG